MRETWATVPRYRGTLWCRRLAFHRRPLLPSLLLVALASCASGGDNGDTSPGDDGGTTSPSADGAPGDSSIGAADSTFDTSATDGSAPDSSARGDAGSGAEAGPVSDSGRPAEASTADALAGEASTGDAGAEAASPSDSGALSDTGAERDAAGTPEAGAPDAGPVDSGTSCPDHGFNGALVTFDLASQPGDEVSAAATSSAAGVTGGPITRAPGLTPITGNKSINASGWSQGSSADRSLYYAFTVTPAAGCTLTLTSLAIDVQASPTGPVSAAVGTSVDGYAALSTAFSGTSTGTVTLPASSASSASPFTVHVFGYAATGPMGTLRIQNTLTLSGTID